MLQPGGAGFPPKCPSFHNAGAPVRVLITGRGGAVTGRAAPDTRHSPDMQTILIVLLARGYLSHLRLLGGKNHPKTSFNDRHPCTGHCREMGAIPGPHRGRYSLMNWTGKVRSCRKHLRRWRFRFPAFYRARWEIIHSSFMPSWSPTGLEAQTRSLTEKYAGGTYLPEPNM